MPLSTIVNLRNLDSGIILAPERYDPRRITERAFKLMLTDVVNEIRETCNPNKLPEKDEFLVFDTGDASDGMILARKSLVPQNSIGSIKKVVQPGDVIISRLRPYLRQVAYIDEGIFEQIGIKIPLLCSSEFFVLRSKNRESIAYIVPLLLSNDIQIVLSASQEGGHHPRFNRETLMTLPLPSLIYNNHEIISNEVKNSVEKARQAVFNIQKLTEECTKAYK
jgi:hypothetical protein